MLRSRLTLYVMAFQTFAYVMAGIESALLPSPVGITVMLGCLGAIYLFLVGRRRNRERTACWCSTKTRPTRSRPSAWPDHGRQGHSLKPIAYSQ